MYFEGKVVGEHRVTWIKANGPIPAGMFICHHCDNKRCVNIEHLYLGTPKDNSMDTVVRGQHPELRKTGCPHGHGPYDRVESNGNRRCSTCVKAKDARKYLRRKAKV